MSDDVRADARRLLQGITEGAWCIWEDLDHQGFRTVGDATSYAELIANGECDECNPVAHVYADHDAEFIAAAPELTRALLAELDRVKQRVCEHAKCPGGSLCCCDHAGEATVSIADANRVLAEERTTHEQTAANLAAALATLQQVREWAKQRQYDGPPTDDLATALLDGAAHQLLRILDDGDEQ